MTVLHTSSDCSPAILLHITLWHHWRLIVCVHLIVFVLVCMSDHDIYCFVEPLQFNRHSGMHGAATWSNDTIKQLNIVEENYFFNKQHLEAIWTE